MKHEFVSSYPDDGNQNEVRAAQWNATHVDGHRSVSSNATLDNTDDLVLATAGASGITVSLPAASARDGQPYTIVRMDSSAGLVTIQPAGSDTIIGKGNYLLMNQYQYVTLSSDGVSKWIVKGAGSPA
jgi:hypothetical protein